MRHRERAGFRLEDHRIDPFTQQARVLVHHHHHHYFILRQLALNSQSCLSLPNDEILGLEALTTRAGSKVFFSSFFFLELDLIT